MCRKLSFTDTIVKKPNCQKNPIVKKTQCKKNPVSTVVYTGCAKKKQNPKNFKLIIPMFSKLME